MNKIKKAYATPKIELVWLDTEISLVLNSDPPYGPDELGHNNHTPDFFNNGAPVKA